MKILISSYRFYPDVGGIETSSEVLANEFVKKGHSVKIVTATGAKGDRKFPFDVIRKPGTIELFKAVKWCDVNFHNGISLRMAGPLLFLRKPWVITHQTWISGPDSKQRIVDALKHFIVKYGKNISISTHIASQLSVVSVVVGNPYQEVHLDLGNSIERNKDLIYVGRLVSDKGVNLLLEALVILKKEGISLSLTIVGKGPEKEKLINMSKKLSLSQQVDFAGVHQGEDLMRMLNSHKIIVVPSVWKEPFGIIALEGMTCGCVPIVADNCGLVEAIGPCGITFKRGDPSSLAEAIKGLLGDNDKMDALKSNMVKHLGKFKPEDIADKYIRIFEEEICRKKIPSRVKK